MADLGAVPSDTAGLMRDVGARNIDAEKIAFTIAWIMMQRPGAQALHQVLVDELYAHCNTTANMVKTIRQVLAAKGVRCPSN